MYPVTTTTTFEQFLPAELREAAFDQTLIPRIAKDEGLMARIESVLPHIPTSHAVHQGDARSMSFLAPNSVHLVVTSPPYWTLKAYEDVQGQLGHLQDYESFLLELDKVWASCYEALVPGGRVSPGHGNPPGQGFQEHPWRALERGLGCWLFVRAAQKTLVAFLGGVLMAFDAS